MSNTRHQFYEFFNSDANKDSVVCRSKIYELVQKVNYTDKNSTIIDNVIQTDVVKKKNEIDSW